jgi:hypothetical protein
MDDPSVPAPDAPTPPEAKPAPRSRLLIRAGYVGCIMHFVADEETRYYLQGFHAEPAPGGGALLVATDGHRMAIYHDAHGQVSGPPQIWLFEDDVLKMIKQRVRDAERQNRDSHVWIEVAANDDRNVVFDVEIFLANTENPADRHDVLMPPLTFQTKVIDGTFPFWRRVFPFTDSQGQPIALVPTDAWINSTYIRHITEAARDWSPLEITVSAKCQPMRFMAPAPTKEWPHDRGQPHAVVAQVRPDLIMVQMPLRAETVLDRPTLPDWFYAAPAETRRPEAEPEPEPLAEAA